jgi:hypothetical protein
VLGECGAGDQILLVWIQAVDGDRSRIGAGPVRGVDNAAEAAFLVVRGIVRGVLERHDGACSGDDIVGNPVAVDGGVVDRVVAQRGCDDIARHDLPERAGRPRNRWISGAVRGDWRIDRRIDRPDVMLDVLVDRAGILCNRHGEPGRIDDAVADGQRIVADVHRRGADFLTLWPR